MRLVPFLFLWTATAGSLPAEVSAVLKGHTRDVNAVACSPDGKVFVSGGDDGAVAQWDATKREKTGESKGDAVLAVAVSADGKRVAAGERYNRVRLTDVAGGTAKQLEGHTAGVIAVQFTADGKLLASMAKDGGIRMWDASTGAAQGALQRIPDALDAGTFTADGKWAVGGAGGFVYLHNMALKKLAWKAPQAGSAKSVAITVDGRMVAAGLNNGTVVLLDAMGKEVGRIAGVDANGLAFSMDGAKLVAAGHDNLVHVMDVAALKVTAVRKGHDRTVRSVCILPAGATPMVVSGSADMTVRLFGME